MKIIKIIKNTLYFASLIFFLAFPSIAKATSLSFLVIEGDSYLVNKSLQTLELPESIEVRFFTMKELNSSEESVGFVKNSDVIIVDVMMKGLVEFIIENKCLTGKRVYALRGSTDDTGLKKRGFVFNESLSMYYKAMVPENIRNLILKVVHLEFDKTVNYDGPIRYPEAGIYHPESKKIFSAYGAYQSWYKKRRGYMPGKPVIGIMLFSSSLMEGQSSKIDTIVHTFEKNGFNVIPAFGRDESVLNDLFKDEATGNARVDLILAFSLKFYSGLNDSIKKGLLALNVPVVNGIHLYSGSIDSWRDDPVGIPPDEVVWKLATPEISGIIEPTPLSGNIRYKDKDTGKEVVVHKAIPESLDRLIPRLKAWIRLKQLPNPDKKVALMYYNHSPGKQNIGASYLNVFRSIETILKRMDEEGYVIRADKEITETSIKEMILLTGRNIGSWAPGELNKLIAQDTVIRIPVRVYRTWFDSLPEAFRTRVVNQWGEPEKSAIMVKNGQFIIPAVRAGNIVMLPEPSRGWSDDPMKLYHDPEVYPHHQYIAAYLWLKHQFSADAMIHLGTHASYEWLPGKQAGLSPSCPPEIMVSDIPNIYPYIVDDVGEGLQAKRRGRGVIIDHLTPSLTEGGLYHEYSTLLDMINSYNRSLAKGAVTASVQFEEIGLLTGKLGVLKDIDVPELNNDSLEKLEHYLLELKSNLMPYGFHTFGVSPSDHEISDTARCIVKRNNHALEKNITLGLKLSGENEIDTLMAALNGAYVRPGEGNDPVRNPSALPTGKNFYGFSPGKVPSVAAWKLGKNAAIQIIEKNQKEKNAWPEKAAVVLWATETLRNEGINESTILYLIGMKPQWDKAGRVTGTEVIPASELGRPRIDVLINPSGLYRDLFPDRLLLLDKAVQTASVQTDIENLIRKNSDTIKKSLMDSGMPEEKAKILSRIRIFTEKPGTYGNGVSEMAGNSGFWKSDDEIVTVYEKRMGFAFGLGKWGEAATGVFQENLKGVDTAVHSRSSNIYATMDNDDMFQYLGGLSLAVKKESGNAPVTLVSRQPDPQSIEVENVSTTIGRELRTRYLNPKWIERMKQENYAGASAMSEFVENMWGWQVTVPDSIDASKWEQTFEVYVEDKYDLDMKAFFNRGNPWAYQSLTARMLEAARKEYWDAGEGVTSRLAREYAMNVVEKGVACCDHTCNNPLLNTMVMNLISIPGVLSPEMVEQFKIAVEQAAGKSLENQTEQLNDRHKAVMDGVRHAQPVGDKGDNGDATDLEPVEGYKLEKIENRDEDTKLTSSGIQWFASLFVMLIVIFFVHGAVRWNRK